MDQRRFIEKQVDEPYFLSVYQEYFPLLFNYGIQIAGNRALVKDAIQDLFIELRTKLALLQAARSVKAYLYTALRRKLVKMTAEEGKYLHLSDQTSFEVVIPYESSLVARQAGDEQRARLAIAFETLTRRQKEAVYLKFYEALSYEEVAATMQLEDVKSARNIIYKAIRAMKSNMLLHRSASFISLLLTFIALLT